MLSAKNQNVLIIVWVFVKDHFTYNVEESFKKKDIKTTIAILENLILMSSQWIIKT